MPEMMPTTVSPRCVHGLQPSQATDAQLVRADQLQQARAIVRSGVNCSGQPSAHHLGHSHTQQSRVPKAQHCMTTNAAMRHQGLHPMP